jgi:hypothetical protein
MLSFKKPQLVDTGELLPLATHPASGKNLGQSKQERQLWKKFGMLCAKHNAFPRMQNRTGSVIRYSSTLFVHLWTFLDFYWRLGHGGHRTDF